MKCTSYEGRREKHSKPVCLDGKVEIVKLTKTITIDGKDIELSEESYQALKNSLCSS